jgi:hypothetical protein
MWTRELKPRTLISEPEGQESGVDTEISVLDLLLA